eukprot:1228-Heterococcus_DN1.PRE.1
MVLQFIGRDQRVVDSCVLSLSAHYEVLQQLLGKQAMASCINDVPRLYQLDIYGGMLLNKTVDMPVGGAGTAMVCGAMLAVGCEDGCVRLYDAALRSRRAEGSFELHTGPVTALAATVSDGGRRLATAGQAAKSLNIFDKNAPRSLHPDSVVRTFDL